MGPQNGFSSDIFGSATLDENSASHNELIEKKSPTESEKRLIASLLLSKNGFITRF